MQPEEEDLKNTKWFKRKERRRTRDYLLRNEINQRAINDFLEEKGLQEREREGYIIAHEKKMIKMMMMLNKNYFPSADTDAD